MTSREKKNLLFYNIIWLVLFVWLALGWTENGYRGVFTVCLTKFLWDIPCPTCGVTRAFLLISHGRFEEALQMNINALFLFPAYVVFPLAGIVGIFTGKNLQLWLIKMTDKAFKRWIVVVPFAIFEITAEALNLYHHFTIGMP